LRSFQERLGEFDAKGIRVLAISVDPPDINAKKMHYTFPLLSDTNAQTIRRYDVFHPAAGPHKEDIARPAEFLIDNAGVVRWRNLTENLAVRARPDQILAAFDEAIGN
jgi:peroxiredoxin